MKKTLILLIAMAMCLSLVACGSTPEDEKDTANEENGTVTEEQKEAEKVTLYQLGDTVSTDLFEFTLDDAAFAYALENTVNENYGLPKEYDAKTDNKNPYVAPTGHTLVAVSFTVSNIGRTREAFYFYDEDFLTVEFNGKKYKSDEYDEVAIYRYQDYSYYDTSGRYRTEDAGKWYSCDFFGMPVGAGEKNSVRAYSDITVDVKDLTSGFEITVKIPNSSGKKEKFTFVVE